MRLCQGRDPPYRSVETEFPGSFLTKTTSSLGMGVSQAKGRENMNVLAEYIWIDGTQPTAQLRSKTKVLHRLDIATVLESGELGNLNLEFFPEWGADGSSTNQAPGDRSDIVLRPVRAVNDPFRERGVLVLCEVYTSNGEPHESNTRANLRQVLDAGAAEKHGWFGFEQEYTFFHADGRPYGFPAGGYAAPQGPYYCGVGSENIKGRPVYEEILERCLQAGLAISGVNWEVMPGQAEIQVGVAPDLLAADQVWLARWIMARVGEDYKVSISFDPKPAKGDWNGAGMHTNFSTKEMREEGGLAHIEAACAAFSKKINEHLTEYGHGYEERLTGHHETASYKEFKFGVSDRTASIRIPLHVAEKGYGYMEDRRPNANGDPYRIAARMLRTVAGID